MKKIIGILAGIVILMLIVNGCSDSSLVEPEQQTVSQELDKTNLNLIPSELSVSKRINGNLGGTILLAGLYRNSSGKIITVMANLKIPRNAFRGVKLITLRTDPELPAINFNPSMEFEKPLNLKLVFTGLNLEKLDLTEDVQFVFLGDDGTIEPTKNDGVQVKLSTGALVVLNAKLEHFSRFCFTRYRY